MAGSVIARLAVTLGLDTTAFSTGSRRARGQAKELEGGLGRIGTAGKLAVAGLAGIGAGIVLGGLQSAVTGAFDLASGMSEAAGRVGLTVEGLQELRVAANAAGLSNDQLEGSLVKLNVQLGDLASGKDTAVAAFAAIGLSAKDLAGLDAQEALGLIADKLAAIEDPALRAAAAQDIFGKSYAQMLPLLAEGKKALDEAAEASRRQGQLTTEEAQQLDNLADSWDRFKTRTGIVTAKIVAFMATLWDAAETVTVAIEGMKLKAGMALWDMVNSVSGAVSSMVQSLKAKLGAAIAWVGDKLTWLKDKFHALRGAGEGAATKTNASLMTIGGGFQQISTFANDNADQTEIATVRIAQSFKDMADDTLNALSSLTGAIKGGGFLDILSGVIGLGLQLGSTGLFGKTIATRINSPNLPTGSGVPRAPTIPNTQSTWASAGGGSSAMTQRSVVEIVDTTGLFVTRVNGQIASASPAIASAGAQGGVARMAYANTRRLA